MAFTDYQKRGIYPWAHSRVIPAITEISRGAGAPGINAFCYQPSGVGAHKTGEAADFQAGTSSSQAKAIHQAIANYVLANWTRLRVRYMAWNGYEYVNAPRARKQTRNYGGTDPFHQRHVHVDFLPGAIPGANPNVPIGGGLTTNPNPIDSSRYYNGPINGKPDRNTFIGIQRFLADRNYYGGPISGSPTAGLWTGLQNLLKFLGYYAGAPTDTLDSRTATALQSWLKTTGHYRSTTSGVWNATTWRAFQTFLTYSHYGTIIYTRASSTSAPVPVPASGQNYPPNQAPNPKKAGIFMSLSDKQQADIYKQTMNISAATRRSEDRERETLTVLAQQNEILMNILTALTTPSQ